MPCAASRQELPRRFLRLPRVRPVPGDCSAPQTPCARLPALHPAWIVRRIPLRRHGGGRVEIFMIPAAAMGAELLHIAAGRERTRRPQGALQIFTSWAR